MYQKNAKGEKTNAEEGKLLGESNAGEAKTITRNYDEEINAHRLVRNCRSGSRVRRLVCI